MEGKPRMLSELLKGASSLALGKGLETTEGFYGKCCFGYVLENKSEVDKGKGLLLSTPSGGNAKHKEARERSEKCQCTGLGVVLRAMESGEF
jgi:hypothetical protein